MRFLLLIVLCSVAALTVAVEKPKREILPGDPRYGTDYHNHDHHDHQENELQVSKSLGGYVGSYSVLNDGIKQSYGPPNYQPNKPLNLDQHTTIVENNAQVPVPAYGVPEVNQVKVLNKQYLSPAIEAAKKKTVDNQHLVPSVKVTSPVTSYGEPVQVKITENTEKPTLYEVPVLEVPKTSVLPLLDTKVEQAVLPQVHDHLEETKNVHKIQTQKTQQTVLQVPDVLHQTAAIESSLVLPVNNVATSFTANTDISDFAPPTIGDHSTFNNHLPSQPDFDTAYQIYLRNLDSFGNQQKLLNSQYSNSYVSPYTYGVPYQLPQFLYTSQVHQPLRLQLNNLVPYPLAVNSHSLKNNVEVKQLQSLGTLFQDTFPNFQFQLPQLPQLPNIGSFFQLPTPVTAVEAPSVEAIKAIKVQKPVEVKTLETADNLFESKPVALDTSLTKTSTLLAEKTSNEYIQPVDKSGAYVY